MFKQIRNLALAATVLFLCSCEGQTTYEYTVVNNTDKDITMHVYSRVIQGNVQSYNIYAGRSEKILLQEKRGGSQTPSAVNAWADSIGVEITGSRLTKNIQNEDHWSAKIRERKKMPSLYEHKYSFTINQSDLK